MKRSLRSMFHDVVLILCAVAAVAVIMPAHVATATTKSIQVLKSPAAHLSLPAGVVTLVPGSAWCSVMVRHHAADAVYWGGPKIGGVVTSGVTVNAAGSLAICTDTTLCEGDIISINVMNGGIALLSVGGTTVEYTTGEGCEP